MFRLDALNAEGKVDLEFFASEEYKEISANLVDYLFQEGFDQVEEKFLIDFHGRKWEITPIKR